MKKENSFLFLRDVQRKYFCYWKLSIIIYYRNDTSSADSSCSKQRKKKHSLKIVSNISFPCPQSHACVVT